MRTRTEAGWPGVALVTLVCLTSSACAGGRMPQHVVSQEHLLFYASYDESPDADFAAGSPGAIRASRAVLVDGKFGRALSFARQGGTRVCEYSAVGNLLGDRGTFAFHFKPDWNGNDPSRNTGLFFFFPGAKNLTGGGNFPDSMSLGIRDKGNEPKQLSFWYDNHVGGNNYVRTPVTSWRKGQWVHVAISWDPSKLSVYLDGELKAWKPLRGLIVEPGERFFVGAGRGSASCEGAIDEVYVYDCALEANEIRLLTRKPELLVPKIFFVEPLQRLYFMSERYVPFRCMLSGRIDPNRHRLRVALLRERGNVPVASGRMPVSGERYVFEGSAPAEGFYSLRVVLADRNGRRLDEKAAQGSLHFMEGPFDR